jgi:trehalose 6-phosphate phosphatase
MSYLETGTKPASRPDEIGVAAQPDLGAPPPTLLRNASLFLDFDGTLVAIVDRPDAVTVGPPLERLISRLREALAGRIAILSGRALAEIDRLLVHGRFAVGGSHGLELRWPDGRLDTPVPPAMLADIVAQMRAVQARHPGVIVEEKPFGAALHYRAAPAAEDACRTLAVTLAQQDGLSLQTGKMVFEIRVTGPDKGGALRALMGDATMRGTTPVFIGDDETDEAAFRAAAALGGAGILVGPSRPTAARYRLDDVAATQDWLERAAENLA